MSARFGLSLLLTLACSALSAGQTTPVTIPGSRQYDFHSRHTGRDYRLFVSLPETYSENDTTHYPVLYVLDGNGLFGVATETHRLLRLRPEVPDLIIVGIGYPVSSFSRTSELRWHDLTPSSDVKADSLRTVQVATRTGGAALHSGGGPQFLAALRDEIIPFIDENLRTTGDRGLFGDSLGGLLATYILLTSPETFSRYGISSPSLWWNNGEMLSLENDYARTHQSLKARVFLSVGGEEDRARMITLVERLATALRDRHYGGLQILAHTFDGESHASVPPAALSRSLRFLYN